MVGTRFPCGIRCGIVTAVLAFAPLTGAADLDESSSHSKMIQVLREIENRTPSENEYFNEKIIDELETETLTFNDRTDLQHKVDTYLKLGQQELHVGRERSAIVHLRVVRDLIEFESASIEALNQARFHLGVAYLRLGETTNCCQRNHIDACLLPIRGGGIHADREGSENAIVQFTEILDSGAADEKLERIVRWLLNIAWMSLGEYPERVPPRFLIPPPAFESDRDFPRFVNRATELGINTFSQLGGAVFDDLDGDGHLDLMVSSWRPGDPLRVFINTGDGHFEDRTDRAGLEGITGGGNLIQGDIDNDGDLDVYVMRGGWFHRNGRHPNSLLLNDGKGRFTDVTFAAGLAEPFYPSQTAAFADFDLDGDLDLYVGNESTPDVEAPSQLFRNNGDGTFTDIAPNAGVTNDFQAKGVTWGDYDGDRYPDLYVSNFGAPNRLYHNFGDGTFWDEAIGEDVHEPRDSFGAWFWDFDNDSQLDLFVADYSGQVGDVAAWYLGQADGTKRDRLYRGLPGGGFEEVSRRVGLVRPTFAMGANFGDLDNDGFLDIYLGTGWPDYYQLMPNVMLLNETGTTFVDVTTSGGFGNLQKGHGIAFADFDEDGDQDVFAQTGGALGGDRYFDALYENPGFGNDWIRIRLTGIESNRSAIGARLHLVLIDESGRRSIHREVNSGGSFGANPLRQEIGLGRGGRVEKLEVFWPRTGRTQVFGNLPKNGLIQITEGQDTFVGP